MCNADDEIKSETNENGCSMGASVGAAHGDNVLTDRRTANCDMPSETTDYH